jgi:hypothetical protein
MEHKKIKGLIIFVLLVTIFSFLGCKKNSSESENPQKQKQVIKPSNKYKEFKLADFEQGVLPNSLAVGMENFCIYQILKDTNNSINFYFSLVNSVCTWDWYLGELRMDAIKFGNADSVFHFNMNETNISNTYLNFNLGGYSDIVPNAFVSVQVFQKDSANAYTYIINLRWTGWKFISIPFDAFTDQTYTNMGNISNIKGIHFTLLFEKGKNISKKPLSMLLDNIVVTQNGVYPNNGNYPNK